MYTQGGGILSASSLLDVFGRHNHDKKGPAARPPKKRGGGARRSLFSVWSAVCKFAVYELVPNALREK
jgi:hypothetical protein